MPGRAGDSCACQVCSRCACTHGSHVRARRNPQARPAGVRLWWHAQLARPMLLVLCPVQVVEGREDFDWTRHAAFCAFGFAYLGGFQYW